MDGVIDRQTENTDIGNGAMEGEEEEEGEKRGRRRMKGHGEMGAHRGETGGGRRGASKRRGEKWGRRGK